jgi:hypothetical protein
MLNRISPAILGIALICFFLPWAEISCQGHKVATVNGFQLATGTTIEGQKTKGEVLAVLALLSTVAGLILCFSKDRIKSLILLILSGIGTIMLLLLKVKLDADILREGKGIVQLTYGAGYYLTLVALLAGAGINAYSYYEIAAKGKLSLQGDKSESVHTFCTECGSKNEIDNSFCSDCGTKLD